MDHVMIVSGVPSETVDDFRGPVLSQQNTVGVLPRDDAHNIEFLLVHNVGVVRRKVKIDKSKFDAIFAIVNCIDNLKFIFLNWNKRKNANANSQHV